MNPPNAAYLLAIDPGREKCGLAVVGTDGKIHAHQVVPTVCLVEEIEKLAADFPPERMLLGNGTASAEAKKKITGLFTAVPLELVDEYRTTDEAKALYWQLSPPTGWRKFVPTSFLPPPVPVDDLAAVIFCQRYLKQERRHG